MPSYLSPGVYVEEVAGGSRPIDQISVSPVRPAEFVVFCLAQFSSGGGELEE
ncbi:hypothetical protein [Streptomyces albicerus]|uniref:hypothetical protein n=1 Tax=Streptomyces albicerus TaxID=2569859 RepID=UPI001788CC50|nr:hypothetical protein [Streptomyces albicerus]